MSELTCMVCELRSILIRTDASASGMEKMPQHKAQAPRMARMTGSFGRLARPAPEGLSFRKSHVNRKVLVRFTKSIACVAANKDLCRSPRLIFPQYSTPGARLTGGPSCGRASLACAPAPRHATQRLLSSSKDDARPAHAAMGS